MPKTVKTVSELDQAIKTVYEARRDRIVNPEGKFDNAGRWYPSAAEDADDYTMTVRSPSRSWPYSYLTAARTRKHVKALAAINPERILAEAARITATRTNGEQTAA